MSVGAERALWRNDPSRCKAGALAGRESLVPIIVNWPLSSACSWLACLLLLCGLVWVGGCTPEARTKRQALQPHKEGRNFQRTRRGANLLLITAAPFLLSGQQRTDSCSERTAAASGQLTCSPETRLLLLAYRPSFHRVYKSKCSRFSGKMKQSLQNHSRNLHLVTHSLASSLTTSSAANSQHGLPKA